MEIPELIQLIRTCNTHQVIAQLESLKKRSNTHSASALTLFEVQFFYECASKQPKQK